MTVTRENSKQAQRKAAMTVLAHSDAAGIASRLDVLALPDHEILREPENGLVMVRGRIGGDGAPFNLGEATVARAAVRLSTKLHMPCASIQETQVISYTSVSLKDRTN